MTNVAGFVSGLSSSFSNGIKDSLKLRTFVFSVFSVSLRFVSKWANSTESNIPRIAPAETFQSIIVSYFPVGYNAEFTGEGVKTDNGG